MRIKLRGLGWLGRRWRRVLLVSAAVLAAGYGVTHAVVTLDPSATDESIVLADGRELAYRVVRAGSGSGGRVVLVHGAPADADSWDRLAASPAGTFAGAEVIAVDRLGYGNSGAGVETSLAAHARSLGGLIEPGTVLMGHSYGGPVVLRAAVEYGDRLGGIVLVAGACDPYMNDAQWFRGLVNAAGAAVPKPWHVANAELLALTDENRKMEPMLDRVTCPVVIVHGTWDPVCPHDGTVAYLGRSLVNAERVEIVSLSRAGHNLHLSHGDEVGRAVRSLIRSGAAAGRSGAESGAGLSNMGRRDSADGDADGFDDLVVANHELETIGNDTFDTISVLINSLEVSGTGP